MSSVVVTKRVNRVVVTAPGPQGATGPTGPAGPAPSGTGLVIVSSGALGTPLALDTYPRTDADQSLTATQKRAARFNIGFSDSFTTTELLALSSTESARLRTAYCSDCLSSAANTPTGRGDLAYWNGFAWLTTADRIPVTSDFHEFALNCGRFNRDLGYTPSIIMGGDQPGYSGLSISSNAQNTASGATVQSIDSTTDWRQMASLRSASTGTTAGAIGRLTLGNPVTSRASDVGVFAVGIVCCHNSTASSPSSSDSYHVRYGVETFVNAANASLQNDMACLLTDQQNILGLGASGANWRALTRISGTTFDYIDTGVPIGNKVWMVATIEPVSGTTSRLRVSTALDIGATFTQHADRQASGIGSAIQAVVAISRGSAASPSNRISRRRFAKFVALRFDSSSSVFVS